MSHQGGVVLHWMKRESVLLLHGSCFPAGAVEEFRGKGQAVLILKCLNLSAGKCRATMSDA